MKVLLERVVQYSPDRLGRIRKRWHLGGFKDYVVERLVWGAWKCSPNGPWDYLSNARRDLRGLVK